MSRKYEGRSYEVDAPGVVVFECSECGERLYNNDAGEQIERAFRAALGLLQPDEIRNGRTELGLSLQDFAARLRISEEALARWEAGALVQSRHADTLMRLYFASPLMRRLLDTFGESPELGRTVRHQEMAMNSQEVSAVTEHE